MTLESIPAQARLLRFTLRSSGRWLCFQVGVAWTGLLLHKGGRVPLVCIAQVVVVHVLPVLLIQCCHEVLSIALSIGEWQVSGIFGKVEVHEACWEYSLAAAIPLGKMRAIVHLGC